MKRVKFWAIRVLALQALSASMCAQAPNGAALFKRSCSTCHSGEENSRAPGLDSLRPKSPEAIVDTLVNGAMRLQGSRLSGAERRALAEFITGRKMGGDVVGAGTGRCTTQAPLPDPSRSPQWNGWGPEATNTRFQPASQAGLTAEQVPHLELQWAFGFPDATSAWAQPSVASGRVFVGSQNGTVYSLNARTGCIDWTFSAAGGVRTAIAIGPQSAPGSFVLYFGDTKANAYAVDASTGKQIWGRKIDDHPLARITGSPTLYNGRLYVPVSSYEEAQGASPDYECCTFRGSVSALDAKTGAVLWKTYTIDEQPKPRGKSSSGVTLWGPSGAAIWSALTIDAKRGLVYAATGNTYSGAAQPASDAVLAFEMQTGKIQWVRQLTPNDVFLSGCRQAAANPNCPDPNGPDYDFGNAPILTRLANGRDRIVIGQKSGVGFALDPDKQGEVIWQYRAGRGGALGGIEWGSGVDADHAYFPVSDITLPNPGGLHAVDLTTGERVWYAPPPAPKCGSGRGCNAAQSAAITVIPGVVFSGSVDGALRGYSTKDGAVVWEFDTNREFKTLNGVPAKGASMLGPGPVVVGGMLYVNSGYGAFGGRAGNVLLAFGINPNFKSSLKSRTHENNSHSDRYRFRSAHGHTSVAAVAAEHGADPAQLHRYQTHEKSPGRDQEQD
ncbi:MAG TPA: PQQ-binding-like beta-propeller repeat protein [Candidatus Saccharimonadales bacterium]|jgi:polyvinyl alcohol dehydrogenase (cytochrome)|nr:PQQ-binding-like beta-propeller repeat protein [Candidatus Saccharimonadales bacterium]